MPRHNNFTGLGSRGRLSTNFNSIFPTPTHQPSWFIDTPGTSGTSFSFTETRVVNYGGGNVYTYTYSNRRPGTSVGPIAPKPKPDAKPDVKPDAKPDVKPEPKPDTKPQLEVLTVKQVDLKVATNSAAHRTSKYAISDVSKPNPQLIVRRGQKFIADIEFSRPYDENTDDLKLIFQIGEKPLVSKGTHVEYPLSAEDKPKEWGAKITSKKDNIVSVELFTPPTCIIGKWKLQIDAIKKEGADTKVMRYVHKDLIYIIFNPWCPEDTVYMQDENLLNEYILNETGKIYAGSKTSIRDKPWNFAQFESCVLDVALYLMDMKEISYAIRHNPIPIVRNLSAMVNSVDDGGLLAGNWSGDYSGGTSPLSWTGSGAILEEFWRTKRSVCYGQCWVFSGICTTLCRTLGIPARSITNFDSAHDTDGSITIDVHFKADGDLDNEANMDSVWNFHCWNECYMSRPDLPSGYGGWQAFDSTPQEASDGVYCGGPTSVIAIQNGEVNLPYDGPFVFAEVNADRVYWKPNNLGMLQCAYLDKKTIGNHISTKAPNKNDREDLTANYKHAEGSAEERAAVLKANQVGSNRRDIYKKTVDDVKFRLIQDPQNNWVGASFYVSLSMKNNSSSRRIIKGCVTVGSMFYTGVYGDKLQSQPFTHVLNPGEEKTENVEVKQDDYDGKLKDCCMLDVSILAHVNETDQNFTIKENFTLKKPNLSVKAPAETMAGKEFKLDLSFANPLSSSLTGCVVTIDGVCPALKFPQGNVAPSGTFTATIPVTPTKTGKQEIILLFKSVQLDDISTSCPIFIRE